MGGSATVGNHTPVGEFNVLADPEAAVIVLESGANIHMAGLDLTHQFVVDDALACDLGAIDGVGPQVLADLVTGYLDRIEVKRGQRIGGLHDPCAILAVTNPEVIEAEPRHVAVELTGTLTRGMTVVDRRPAGGATPNVMHGHTLNHPAARQLVLDAVAALGRNELPE